MTDSQIVAIAITVLAVLGGTLFNNVRISDLNNRFGDVNNRIGDVKEVLRAEMKLGFERIDHKLDDILRIVGDYETRITKIEERLR